MTGDDRPPAATEPHHHGIEDAVDVVASPEAGGYRNVEYLVSETSLAGIWTHEIDISAVPTEREQAATMSVIVALAKRGFSVNAVDFASERMHVVREDWFDDHRGVRPDELDTDLSVLDDDHDDLDGVPDEAKMFCQFCGISRRTSPKSGKYQFVNRDDKILSRWWCCDDHFAIWVKALRMDPNSPDPENEDWTGADPRTVEHGTGPGAIGGESAADRGDRDG